jgi:ATP-dependent helicase HrpA
VHDASSFQRWWKKAATQHPELLNLTSAAIVQRDANEVTPDQYPDSLEVRGVQLPVQYRFSPGDSDDGLRVRVPLAALSQVSNPDFEWLVPGLLKEKCTLLIKSLPKPLRRHFVPAPDFAEACIQAMDERSGSLIDALSRQLTRISDIDIPADAWRADRLPAHLAAFFEVVDVDQKVLGHGADLEQLRQALRDQIQGNEVRLTDARFERQDVRRWDFGELPEYVELDRGGIRLRAYPALTADHWSRISVVAYCNGTSRPCGSAPWVALVTCSRIWSALYCGPRLCRQEEPCVIQTALPGNWRKVASVCCSMRWPLATRVIVHLMSFGN